MQITHKMSYVITYTWGITNRTFSKGSIIFQNHWQIIAKIVLKMFSMLSDNSTERKNIEYKAIDICGKVIHTASIQT